MYAVPMKEGTASFKLSSSFSCLSAVFQKLVVAQRAGVRLSLMGRGVGVGEGVWERGGGGWTDYLTECGGAVESKSIEGVRG